MFDIVDMVSSRVSTMIRSGGVPSRASRSSMTLTGIAPDRSKRPTSFLKVSSSLTTSPANCAMLLNQSDVLGEYAGRHWPAAAREETGNRSDPTNNVVALHALDEEAEIVDHLELGVLTALLALR